jgi:hypothetical protein
MKMILEAVMKRDEIVQKVIEGIKLSQKEYLDWEGVSVSWGPEYLLTVNIAKSLSTLGDSYKPSLELNIKNAVRDSGSTTRISNKKRAINGRGDIILYKNDEPCCVIEVKNGVKRIDKIAHDIDRILYIINKEKKLTTWKHGIMAFLMDIDRIEKDGVNIKDELESKILSLFDEVKNHKEFSKHIRDCHYDIIQAEPYKFEDKQRIWAWSPVCFTFS